MKTRKRDLKVPAGMLAVAVVLILSLLAWADDPILSVGAPDSSLPNRGVPGVSVAPAATGQAAGYVKFDGVDGEALDRDHKDWINLLSFSQGQFIPQVGATGSARARAGVQFEDLVLVKEMDKSSPKLAEAVCKGKVFPKVEIHLTSSLLEAQTYCAYELTNVIITSYHVASSGTEERPTEQVSLNFEEIKVTYTEYDYSTGRTRGNVEYTWKVEEGES